MNFKRICRLCLEEKSRLQTIFDSSSVRDIFSRILQIEVYDDDQLPQKVCHHCIATMTKLDDIIRQFRENDAKLRRLLYGSIQVKNELMEMEIEPLLESEVTVDKVEQSEDEEEMIVEGQEDVDPSDAIESPEFEALERKEAEVKYDKSTAEPLLDVMPKKRKQGRPRVRPVVERRRRKTKVEKPDKPKKGDSRCYICKSDPFGSAEALLAHLDVHIGELPYTCTVCVQKTVVITNVSSLNVHKRMHANPVKCPHCDSRFSGKGSLDLHIMMQHQEQAPDEKPSTCKECGKVFLTARALKFHMHTHETPMACEVCGKVFKAKMMLTRHIKRVHGNGDRVECHLCQKVLITVYALQTHIATMHSTEQLQCKYCPRLYPSKQSLTYHEKQHELKPNYSETMSSHWRQYYTIEGEKGAQTKTCNLCGLVLGSAIGHHYRTKHFPEAAREHRCTLCDVVFKQKKALEVHMLEHTHGKFLKCPICGKEFAEKRYLAWHMKTKKHRDHPLAQSLDWIESDLPSPTPKRMVMSESAVAVAGLEDGNMPEEQIIVQI